MFGSTLKEISGGLVLFAMFAELLVWFFFVAFRHRRGNPLRPDVVWRVVALILMVGLLGAIIAPILVAAQTVSL